MSYFMLPWLAIRLIDFFWTSRDSAVPVAAYYQLDGPFGRVRWPGLIAFLIAIAVSVPFMSSPIFVGPFAQSLGGADVSYFVSFVVAALLYAITAKPVTAAAVTAATDPSGALAARPTRRPAAPPPKPEG